VKISLEWIRDYVDLPVGLTPDEVAQELTLKTAEVEDVSYPGTGLANVVVGVIEAVEPFGNQHQAAVTCRIGGNTVVPIVTAVRGLLPGMLVAVALPGARLVTGPDELVEVSARTISGLPSAGVICTPSQLGLQRLLGSADLVSGTDLSGLDVSAGTPLAQVLGFNDAVLEVDNQSLTNRPDLWGHYGIARELAAIYNLALRPLPSATVAPPASAARLIGEVDGQVCQQFTAIAFETASGATEAPLWLRSRLVRVGQASVNLCVDLSNYVMYTTGQPTHIYDADRIGLPLSARSATGHAQLRLVDGSTVDVTTGTPVISDAAGPVAVAGVMGGAASAVSPDSCRYALEAATFRPRLIRVSAQRLGLRTEASVRYEKGIDTQRSDAAVGLFFHLLNQVAPDAKLTAVHSVSIEATKRASITVGLDFMASRMGAALDPGEITRTLAALGFEVGSDDGLLRLEAPTWRSTGDVSLPEDIVEEAARIHGYDNLPTAQLAVALRPARALAARQADRTAREVLAFRAQLREVVTYPWTSDAMLAAVGWDKAATVKFDGAPAPDQGSLRPSLVPNLIEATARNLRYTAAGVGIFEIGTVFWPGPITEWGAGSEPMPAQPLMLAGLLLGSDGEILFRSAKGILELLNRVGQLTTLGFAPETSADTFGEGDAKWADPSARAAITVDGKVIGRLGLLTRRCERLSGLEGVQVACFELDLRQVAARTSRDNTFDSLPELPEADFDLSVVAADQVPWSYIAAVTMQADPLVHRVDFNGEFRGSWVSEGYRSLTLRVTLRPKGATLNSELIAGSRERVLVALASQADAHPRA
jgi:phenylalanyl-tRNA synthetase beta chain